MTGDWSVRRPELAPGGWAFEFANDGYPDTDDTAEIVLALRRVAHPDSAKLRASSRPRRRLDGRHAVARRRLGRVRRRQHPYAAEQAAVLRLRRGHRPAVGRRHRARRGDARARGQGRRNRRPARRRVAAAPTRSRTARGSAAGAPTTCTAPAPSSRRWSRPAWTRAPSRSGAPSGGSSTTRIRTAAGARICARTTTRRPGPAAASRPPRRPRGRCSRCSPPPATRQLETATSGCRERDRAWRRFLVDTQRADGGWDEDLFTGTGFPGDFYINYHLYRLVFPISALGRYLKVAS